MGRGGTRPYQALAQALKVLISSSSLSASAGTSAWVGGLETAGDISNLWFVFRRPCSTAARPSRESIRVPPRPQRGGESPLPITFVFYGEGIGWLPFAAPPGSTF